MGHLDFFVRDLALILVVCAVITILFRKLRLPVVLGYILTGFLISPNFVYLPTVLKEDNVNHWATIGIVFLMFALGLEFSFKRIAKVGSSAIITAMTVMTAMVVIGAFTGRLLGFDRIDCLFIGGMLSISSTMVILKSYEEYGLTEKPFATLVLGVMVIEDIGGIFMMIVLSTVAAGREVSGMDMVFEMAKLLIFLGIWLVLGIYLIPSVLRRTRYLMNDETLLITALAICFGMVIISHMIGFSEALGAFLGGSIVAGTVASEKIDQLIKPLKDLFGAVFFVSVGMMLEPDVIAVNLRPILILAGVTIIGQMTFGTLGILFSGRTLRTAVCGGFSMVQIGEFSFIIAALGQQLGVTSRLLYPIIVCVAVITMALTPLFIKNSERACRTLNRHMPRSLRRFLHSYTEDKRDSDDNDDDWKRMFRRYFLRTGICAGLLFVIHIAGTRYLVPAIGSFLDGVTADIVVTVILCLLMLLPVSILYHHRDDLFVKLWVKNKTNRLPLTLLRAGQVVIAAAFFGAVFRHFLHLSWWLILPIAVILALVISRIDFLRSQAIRVEARFFINFNERLLHRLKQENRARQWMGDHIYVAEFRLTNPYDIPTVSEVYDDRYFDMRVIKVIRGERHFNIPKGDVPIEPGDIVQLIGTRDELDAYLILLENDENIETPSQPIVTMRDYLYGQTFRRVQPADQIIYTEVEVGKNATFAHRTVKSCGFREKYKGFIVGIERHGYPIIDPSLQTVIQEGDILWVVGTEETGTLLIHDNLIQEV
ncbi:MAG: cation:proton antiporter [Anaerovoracaceae bacterium]|jgi:CPA2 family monovalent cation:H+ antiporter-2